MARLFEGRVVVMTGASAGIGRTTALAFAKQGAAVVVSARRVLEGEETAAAIRALNGDASFVRADITRGEEVDARERHAIVGMTKAAALEYALQGIRVNAVCPGSVLTEMSRFATMAPADRDARAKALHPMGRLYDLRKLPTP